MSDPSNRPVAQQNDNPSGVYDDYVRRELNAAFEEVASNPLEPWEIEATINEARRREMLRSARKPPA